VFDDASPIYRQIADEIRQDIVTGALGPDEQVMSTNQYAAFHRINPATVNKAFQGLADEGLLYKRRGIGMFVHADARERLLADRRARFVDEHVAPVLAEARRLAIPTDEVVAAIRSLDPGDDTGGSPPATVAEPTPSTRPAEGAALP
jgi:DNA-binding transcriptional regulator YhcF (GntR family)